MTKEEIQYEAQSIMQEWGSNDSAPYVEFVEKLASMELPESSSNLDEAAEEYAYNNWEDNDYHTGASEGLPFDAIGHTEKCFKAGAEWMAGQGVSMLGKVGIYGVDVESITKELREGGFKIEEEVILQIRKKQ